MFYTYTEKVQNSLFGNWRMRAVAFDTRRRYLYYSEPLPEALLHPAKPTSSPAAPASVSSVVTPQSSAAGGSAASSHDAAAESCQMSLTKLSWKLKLKVSSVVPLATTRTLNLSDPRLADNDLYQLEISGETRPLATGEVPPLGPLLCPSAGLTSMAQRCTLENAEFIADPFFLKELFNALRDQFEEMERDQRGAEAAAAARGLPVVPSQTLTINSPRGGTGGGEVSAKAGAPVGKRVKVVLRCRNEREFRRLWYVLQTVLGYDRLIVRPYRGLPPYDPRNMVAFAHIPMAVWHTFKALDKAVFYVFMRGDVMGGPNAGGELVASLHGCYMCVTHDMVYFMRDTGNIPRWIRLQEVREFHFNVTAAKPFFALLSDPPAPDVLVVPLPPLFGPVAAATFDAVFEVRRMQRVMHDTCFASLAIRRVVKLVEATDATVEDYVERMRGSGFPLRLTPDAAYNSSMSCPLPKEQLAAVWHEVQTELRARSEVARHAAIPLYEETAPDLQLSGEQLQGIARQLDGERERVDDVVGMPLERARQVPGVPAEDTTHPSSSSFRQPSRRRSSLRPLGVTVVLPATAGQLQTPQVSGTVPAEERRDALYSARDVSSNLSTSTPSERSSYLVPGSRYISRAEVEGGGSGSLRLTMAELEAIAGDQHEEVESGSPRGLVAAAVASTWETAANGAHLARAARSSVTEAGDSLYSPERTVNELVRESMAALEKTRQK